MNLPRKFPVKGPWKVYIQAFNDLLDYVKALRPKSTINEEVDHTGVGVARRTKGKGTGDSTSVPRWG